jgi:ribosomal protein S18 acetylase RimI-like enzyme
LGSTFAKSFYLQFLYDSASTCIVAEDLEGSIIGCGTAKVVRRVQSNGFEREGHILTLAVDPAWRRRGIGRDILEVPCLFEDYVYL